MQNLPEASDEKRDRPDKRKTLSLSLSLSLTGRVKTSKSSLLLEEDHVAALKRHVGQHSLGAAVSECQNIKKYQNWPIELRTKTLDLDKFPKATNALLKL